MLKMELSAHQRWGRVNIDHNPTSTTSQTSFHGPSLSQFQLPEIFTNIKPSYIIKNPNPPAKPIPLHPAHLSIHRQLKEEYTYMAREGVSYRECGRLTQHHVGRPPCNTNEKPAIWSELDIVVTSDTRPGPLGRNHQAFYGEDTVAFLNTGQLPFIAAY